MPSVDLNLIAPAELQRHLDRHATIVACLCAAWCDVCKSYRPDFEALASQFPETLFVWIDIEDQSSLVDDLDVDNFPTLLIQQQDIVSFYGTMQPDPTQLKRMLQSLIRQSPDQLRDFAGAGALQRSWQHNANLRKRLAAHV